MKAIMVASLTWLAGMLAIPLAMADPGTPIAIWIVAGIAALISFIGGAARSRRRGCEVSDAILDGVVLAMFGTCFVFIADAYLGQDGTPDTSLRLAAAGMAGIISLLGIKFWDMFGKELFRRMTGGKGGDDE